MGPLRVPAPEGRRRLRARGVAVHDRSGRAIESVGASENITGQKGAAWVHLAVSWPRRAV